MDMDIRKAAPDDYDDLSKLFDRVDTMHCEKYPDIYQKAAGPARSMENIIAMLNDPDQCILLACKNGETIGAVCGFVRDTPDHPVLVPRRFAQIDVVVVDKRYARRGVGHLLLEHFQKWAESKGAASMELHVYNFNVEAVKFYRKEGFEDLRQIMRKKIK